MKLATCHPQRKVKVRGLCGSCYDRELREKNPEYKKRQQDNSKYWKTRSPEAYQSYLLKEKARQEERKAKDPVKYKLNARNRMLKQNYGITHDIYLEMLKKQEGGCAICFRKPKENGHLHVDHDHKNGRVRGLLCHQCNWYLGTIDSDPDIMVRLQIYKSFKYDSYLEIAKERR